LFEYLNGLATFLGYGVILFGLVWFANQYFDNRKSVLWVQAEAEARLAWASVDIDGYRKWRDDFNWRKLQDYSLQEESSIPLFASHKPKEFLEWRTSQTLKVRQIIDEDLLNDKLRRGDLSELL
jgi:hypothetical protein